jgi:hypothetical protein
MQVLVLFCSFCMIVLIALNRILYLGCVVKSKALYITCVCVCVCVEKERERDTGRERGRERESAFSR